MEKNYSSIFHMHSVTIIRNFLSKEECSELNEWAIQNENKEFFKTGKEAENRKTTRYSKNIEFKYPILILEKFQHFKKEFGVENLNNIEQGKNGIICAISTNGSILRKHKDPSHNNFNSFHLVIQTSKSEIGGELVINDRVYKVNEGDVLCFFADCNEHYTTENIGSKPRIVWILGIKMNFKKTLT